MDGPLSVEWGWRSKRKPNLTHSFVRSLPRRLSFTMAQYGKMALSALQVGILPQELLSDGGLQLFSTSNPELQRDEGMDWIVYSKPGAAMDCPVLFQRRPDPFCGQLGGT